MVQRQKEIIQDLEEMVQCHLLKDSVAKGNDSGLLTKRFLGKRKSIKVMKK
jgi:hypothetical protein